MQKMTVEELLFLDQFEVDHGNPHIKIIDQNNCLRCEKKQCTVACPCGCWTKDEKKIVAVNPDGCLECGTCRIICNEYNNVSWRWPRGGFGVRYRCG